MKKVTLLLIVALGMAGFALAQGPQGGPPPGGRGGPRWGEMGHGGPGPECPMVPAMRGGAGIMMLIRRPALAEKVGLTQEEVQKLRNMTFDHQKEMIELRASAERARLDLEKAKTAETPKLADVEKAIDEVHRIQAEIDKAQYRYQQAVRSVISEERLEQLWESVREAREKWLDEPKVRHRADMDKRFGRRGMHRRLFGKPGPAAPTPKADVEDDETED